MSRTHQVEPVEVDGVAVHARIPRPVTDLVLDRLAALPAADGSRRVAFLVGPPGAGKSTLASVLVERARDRRPVPLDLAAVSMDGFHHPAAYLATHGLTGIKGQPETFDLPALTSRLRDLRSGDVPWPRYDRTLHDVVAGTEPVAAPVVLVEGNWLLLEEPGWADLAELADLTIFLDADPALLHRRLVDRKVRGGLSAVQAEEFYQRSDRHNVDRVLGGTAAARAHLVLSITPEGTIEHGGTA